MTNYQHACVHCDAFEDHIRIEVLEIISRNSKEGVVDVYRNVETKKRGHSIVIVKLVVAYTNMVQFVCPRTISVVHWLRWLIKNHVSVLLI